MSLQIREAPQPMLEPRVALLDVNVLLALFDPMHVNHQLVRDWYVAAVQPVATCPLVELGFVRIVVHPRYPNPLDHPTQALALLRALHEQQRHQFWPDQLSLADNAFTQFPFQSHRETTDRYLLRLAVVRHGVLLTLDGGITPADDFERAAVELLRG